MTRRGPLISSVANPELLSSPIGRVYSTAIIVDLPGLEIDAFDVWVLKNLTGYCSCGPLACLMNIIGGEHDDFGQMVIGG